MAVLLPGLALNMSISYRPASVPSVIWVLAKTVTPSETLMADSTITSILPRAAPIRSQIRTTTCKNIVSDFACTSLLQIGLRALSSGENFVRRGGSLQRTGRVGDYLWWCFRYCWWNGSDSDGYVILVAGKLWHRLNQVEGWLGLLHTLAAGRGKQVPHWIISLLMRVIASNQINYLECTHFEHFTVRFKTPFPRETGWTTK